MAPRRSSPRAWHLAGAVLALLLLALPAGVLVSAMAARGVSVNATPALTGNISGPTYVGTGLKATFRVQASGGPAVSPNGSVVGRYSYNATLLASNETGLTISPSLGVLVNQSVNLSFVAGNVSEPISLHVEITSSANATANSTTNETENITYAFNIVLPYVLTATVVSRAGATLNGFNLTVYLDGAIVGQVTVPTLAAKASVQVTYNYVTGGLSSGWHTFSLSLASQKGLVVFANGAQQYSVGFYVPAAAPNYTIWYVAGAVAFIGALFIWATRVAARRRGGRAKK
jgi:hypothetical protein